MHLSYTKIMIQLVNVVKIEQFLTILSLKMIKEDIVCPCFLTPAVYIGTQGRPRLNVLPSGNMASKWRCTNGNMTSLRRINVSSTLLGAKSLANRLPHVIRCKTLLQK